METVSELVTTFIINAIWQVSVLLLIAGICSSLMRNAAARHKHILWTAILILSVSLPILSLGKYGTKNFSFDFQTPFNSAQGDIVSGSELGEAGMAQNEISIQSVTGLDNSRVTVIFTAITIFYFAFLFYQLIILSRTWRRTVQLRRSGRIEKLPPLLNAVAERCSSVLQTNSVPILFSSKTKAPLTLGTRKPLIILPESFLEITSEETLTAAIGHESAHIRRRDYGLNLVCEFLSLLVSFHPAVKVMKRKIDQTREMACDELVSEHLLRPLDYARSLVQIAGFISPASPNAYTLGVFNADILEKRIMKLIEKSRGATSRTGKIRFLFVSALLGVSAIAIPAFSLALPTNQMPETKSEKKESNNKDEEKVYKVEMYSGGERVASVTLIEETPGRTKYGYVLRTIPKNQIATTPEGEKVYALQLLPRLQKDTVKVEVIALLEDPETISNEHPLDKFKKQLVGTYNITEGEQITLSEMTQFGMQPLEIRVTFGDKTNPIEKDRQTKTVLRTIQPNKKDSNAPADKEFPTTANGNGTQPLRILSKSTAQYTDEARKNGTSGTVKLRVIFLASGAIGEITPMSELPDGLTENAVAAARGIKFQPATENGTPLTVTKTIEYSFTNF